MKDMSTKRATLDELKEFANKVRKAGGGNPIDALLPAIPIDPSQCLIAKNLNFNCTVTTLLTKVNQYENQSVWVMILEDRATRDKIAKALNLQKRNHKPDIFLEIEWCVILPKEIGRVASDFDTSSDLFEVLSYNSEELSDENKALMQEMWPYIDESTKEAYNLAGDYVTKDGNLIL